MHTEADYENTRVHELARLGAQLRLNRETRRRAAEMLVRERESLKKLVAEADRLEATPKWLRLNAWLTRTQVQRVREGRLPRPMEVTE